VSSLVGRVVCSSRLLLLCCCFTSAAYSARRGAVSHLQRVDVSQAHCAVSWGDAPLRRPPSHCAAAPSPPARSRPTGALCCPLRPTPARSRSRCTHAAVLSAEVAHGRAAGEPKGPGLSMETRGTPARVSGHAPPSNVKVANEPLKKHLLLEGQLPNVRVLIVHVSTILGRGIGGRRVTAKR
jgi:hypothetical protein